MLREGLADIPKAKNGAAGQSRRTGRHTAREEGTARRKKLIETSRPVADPTSLPGALHSPGEGQNAIVVSESSVNA